MNENLAKANYFDVNQIVIGGFVGTIVMTLMMYFGAPMMIGAPMDIASELANMMGIPWIVGMIIHFMLGTVVFSFAYAFVAARFLPGHAVVSGLIWGVLLWLVAMLVMGPMMGKGLFMGASAAAAASLVGHLLYGVTLGLIVSFPTSRS